MKLVQALCIMLLFFSCSQKNNVYPTTNTNKPNVILVITDDQGYGDVGALGNTLIKTPHLDNFYEESYHLTNFHVGPTCAPTRSALMTGRYANSVGVWHTVGGWSILREDEKTLANMFEDAGYATGAFGKWHLGDNYPFRPEDRGFQETVTHGGGGVYQTPDYWGNTYFNDTYFNNGKPKPYQGYCTDVFFNEAIHFVASNKNKPFFCYISTNAPHGPYNVPLEYYDLYKNVPKEKLTETQKRFYGMITNVDDNFGKLRKAITELGVADNTILIFMTDNGTSAGYVNKNGKEMGFNAGMRGHKGSEYDGGHRVPFFIHWKNGKLTTATDINQLTAQIDVLPTLAELCGIALPKNHKPIDGESIVPLLKYPNKQNDRMLITDSQRVQVPEKYRKSAVMQGYWRLVNGKELYNVADDKGQNNDVSKQFPERVTAMREFYENWWTQVSVDFENEIHIPVGTLYENPVTLTAHDIHAPDGNQPWNQVLIREGKKGFGYWSIDIKEAGDYKISLRRYPVESGLAINATAPEITKTTLPGLEQDIPEGIKLDIVRASVEIDGQLNEEVNVKPNAASSDFNVSLKPGKTKMKAGFTNDKGELNVAYYVYVEKL